MMLIAPNPPVDNASTMAEIKPNNNMLEEPSVNSSSSSISRLSIVKRNNKRVMIAGEDKGIQITGRIE